MSKSYVIYDGPSLIDGKPIVCIAQIDSRNKKTGNMVQTYIIRKDVDPITASRTGEDYSICGDCIHKGKVTSKESGQAEDRTCYVTLAHGPLNKYKGLIKGLYEVIEGHEKISSIAADKIVRVGTYGDPCAVPMYIWESLLFNAKAWTAYTHGEKNVAPEMFMTSADSLSQAMKAWERNERTFRVLANIADKHSNEVLCPASAEMGNRVTCEKCKLCSGKSAAKSIAIVAHGNGKNKLIKKLETL